MRLHVLGLPHTQIRKDLPWAFCAYTQKVYNICKMFFDKGHEVYLYAHGNSTAPCTELIDFYPEGMFEDTFGEIKEDTRTSFGEDVATYIYARDHFADEVNSRYTDDSIVLAPFGDIFGGETFANCKAPVVESSVGYPDGHFAHYKVWESHFIRNYSLGIRRDNSPNWSEVVIPGYINEEDYEFSEEKDNYFLYVGRLEEDYFVAKGVDLILELQKRLGFNLKLAGPGKPKSNPSPGVEYLGPVYGEEKAKLMSKAKAVITPSLFPEPFCNVSVEALMSGTPVITTNHGAFEEHVTSEVGFRCVFWYDFLKAIRNIDTIDPFKCREYALNKFSLGQSYKQYMEFFSKVLPASKKGWYFREAYETFEEDFWNDPQNFLATGGTHAIFKSELEINNDQTDKNILDIGGGPQPMSMTCMDYKSIDVIDPINFIEKFPILERVYEANDANFILSTLEDFKTDKHYDEVWCYNVMQHTPTPDEFLESFLKLCRPGTTVRICEPVYREPYVGHPTYIEPAMFDIMRDGAKKIIKDVVIKYEGKKLINDEHLILIMEF